MSEMTSQEIKIRSALDLQRQNGFGITSNCWFTFRDGRTPPTVSPWGAILWTLNSTKTGNFLIPGRGTWWNSVITHLDVTQSWMDIFTTTFDGSDLADHELQLLSDDDRSAYNLAQKIRSEYIGK